MTSVGSQGVWMDATGRSAARDARETPLECASDGACTLFVCMTAKVEGEAAVRGRARLLGVASRTSSLESYYSKSCGPPVSDVSRGSVRHAACHHCSHRNMAGEDGNQRNQEASSQ